MFTSVGSQGSANAKAAGSTLTISPSSNMAAGQLLVAWVSWDGITSSANHIADEVALTDDAGNIYTAVYAMDTFAGNGPFSALFICQLQHALTTGNVLTFTGASAGSIPKAISLWEFSITAGNVWAATDFGPVRDTQAIAQPAAVTIAGLPNQEYLFLYAVDFQGPSTDTLTITAGYTAITQDGTTGGAANSNRTVYGGFHIVTATTDTCAASDSTAIRASCSGIVAICGVPDPGVFPTAGVLDNFARADADPLDGVLWDTACLAGQDVANMLRLVSGQVGAQVAATGTEVAQFWTTALAVNEAEAYVAVPVSIVADTNSWATIALHCGGCRGTANLSGLRAIWKKAATPFPPVDSVYFGTIGTLGALTNERAICYVTRPNGAHMGIRKAGHVAHCFLDTGSGYTRIMGFLVVTFPDVWSSGSMAIGVADQHVRLSNFGGGPVVVPGALEHLLPILGVGA